MGRYQIGFGLFLALVLVLSYQNCSDTRFSADPGGSPSVTSSGSVDDAYGDLAQYGLPTSQAAPNLCLNYSDEATGGECYTQLKHKPIVFTRTSASGDIVVRVVFPREFVDNTYGANSIGWPVNRGHTLKDLLGSDHVELALYDKADQLVLQAKLDYITEDKNTGKMDTLGVDGGDGKLLVGDRSNVVAIKTSLATNFNEFGYVLTTDSPATDAMYSVNPSYPNWIYHVWYEITLKASAFAPGGGIGKVLIPSIHASPSKIGINTCVVEPGVCE
ncbi:MAG: hypothetical protein AB7F86_12055 [Bdellovibrionales bacterium]